MANVITIELCAEDRARLDRLTAFLEERIAQVDKLYGQELPTRTGEENTQAETPETSKPEQEPTPKTEPATAPSNEPTKEAAQPKATIEDVRSQVIKLNGLGMKDKVIAIVHEYAQKVPDIPADKLDVVMKKLTALEG